MSSHETSKGPPDASAGLFFRLWQRFIAPPAEVMVKRYRIRPKGWPTPLRIAMVSDLHMGDPYMPLSRLDAIVEQTRALKPDLVLLPGDLVPGPSMVRTREPPLAEIAARLARLKAPLGTYAVLGNHDWWSDTAAQARKTGPVAAGQALQAAGIPVLSNRALGLKNGVWLAGLESQEALRGKGKWDITGLDDLTATLARVPPGAPTLLLAHEPYIFADLPDNVAVTLSGHTHGGQIRIRGWAPIVPRTINRKYLYGHITEGDRHLVVSAGLGYSKLPLRIGTPPEITLVDLAADTAT